MSEREFSFHLFDEREFRERFLPAVQGQEPIVRELLEAADASGPSWTALHKLFDETRAEWQKATAAGDAEHVQRVLFSAFAQFLGHLRPAYCVHGFGLSTLDQGSFAELVQRIKSPGQLLLDDEGQPLEGVPADLPRRVPLRAQPVGRCGGGYVPKADVRGFLDAFRDTLPRIATQMQVKGEPAEAGLTVLLSALVEAKLNGSALLEATDALLGDTHLPKDHRLTFAQPDGLPPACVREVGKLFGRTQRRAQPAPPPPPPQPSQAPAQVVPYSPKGTYEVGQRLAHKSFGTGEVIEILDSRRMKAVFQGDEKTLVMGLGELSAPPAGAAAVGDGDGAAAADE